MTDKQPLVIIAGPTGVGKTELSIQLAKKINGSIISADSMQVYKYMDIGTAKIKPEEMQGVRHYLIDCLKPDEEFNVATFKQMAKEALEDIASRGEIPILVGGTGFYIQALLYDIDFDDDCGKTEVRAELESYLAERGPHELHELLRDIDKVSYDTIHENNTKRVIRALEYYRITGEPISVHNEREKQKESPYDYRFFCLNTDREILYERIDKRVDIMLEEGLVDEVKSLRELGYNKGLVSQEGLGYKEIHDYLNGLTTLDEAVSILKRDTRHFAKRQLTWFRREKDIIWIEKNQDNLLGNVMSYIDFK